MLFGVDQSFLRPLGATRGSLENWKAYKLAQNLYVTQWNNFFFMRCSCLSLFGVIPRSLHILQHIGHASSYDMLCRVIFVMVGVFRQRKWAGPWIQNGYDRIQELP